MHIIRTLLHAGAVLALLGALFVSARPAQAIAVGETIVVNTTADALGDGKCSFREAVDAADNNTEQDSGACNAGSATGLDNIHFAIAGSGVQTINLTTTVSISEPVAIDGATQPGYAGVPLINLRIDTPYMLTLAAGSSGSVIRALRFTNVYPGDGHGGNIWINGSNSNRLIGNYFNTNGTGVRSPRGVGVIIGGGSTSNIIGGASAVDRNLFGGLRGIEIQDGSYTQIRGNYFGVQADGVTPLTDIPVDVLDAIYIGGPSTSTMIRENIIGMWDQGILLGSGSNHTTIVGNKIGLGADGVTVLANREGIAALGSTDNTIGGVTEADRNVVSGNSSKDIILSSDSDANVIQGNYIGTDGAGLNAVTPGASTGIQLTGGAGNTIGGSAAGAGNVISGHADEGITVLSGATGTVILGNKIGTDKDGLHALPNGTGINLYHSSANIGDAVTPGNNLISGNDASYYGIYISTSSGTSIYGNKIGVSAAGLALPNGLGIALEGMASAAVAGNWIAHGAVGGLYANSTSTITSAVDNCFTGNEPYGVNHMNAAGGTFDGNWWGAADGPSGTGFSGSGDEAWGYVTVNSFLDAPAAICSPAISLSAASLDFGEQLLLTGRALPVTLTNHSLDALDISLIATAAPYSINPTSTCPNPGTLAAGHSCVISVKFLPTDLGPVGAHAVSITSNSPTSVDHVLLSGTGVAGTQILKNRSFETDADANEKPDNFIYALFNAATDGQNCTVKKDGACSLKLAGNGNTKTVTQTLYKPSLGGHDDFTYSLWSKAGSVPAGSLYRVQVKLFKGATLLTTKTKTFTTGTHAFQQVTGAFSVSKPYTKIVFKITFDAASGNAWFDLGALNRAP